jgi:hypothetical protein
MQEALSPAQDAEAQELAAVLTQLAGEDLLAMARVLVAGPPEAVFGENEFKLRDLAHRVAAKAAQARLKAAKKGATRPG